MANIVDPIHGSIELSDVELLVIDTPPFQRLRKIKQLGNVHLVFPGATHTRFSHSLGVMHLAGQLYDSIMAAWPEAAAGKVSKRIRQRVRLAALLHDIGHGPFSHQFEQFLKAKKLCIGDISEELRVPSAWGASSENSRPLSHEDFSFGITRVLFEELEIKDVCAQDICSLLDDEIKPSDEFLKDLQTLTNELKVSNDAESLKSCFKSILSGEIDADRLDYLQRDSLFCGSRIAGIDVPHILNSIKLACDAKGAYYIEVKPNAISAIEQVLISRKLMFDQVYTHHVNAAFDEMLVELMTEWIKVKKPLTYSWYLSLSDDRIEQQIQDKIATEKSLGELDIMAKFFVTRTTLKKVFAKLCEKTEVSRCTHELNKIWNVGVSQRKIVKFTMKDFTKLGRDKLSENKSVVKIPGDYEGVDPTPINLASPVFKSSLWRADFVKLVVFEGLNESAKIRPFGQKIKLLKLKGKHQARQSDFSAKKSKSG